jgi:predicted nucleotidyltransferase
MMAKILEDDLDKYISASGSSREKIRLATRGAREVIVYSSAMDGLGTPTSDLDIYAIGAPGTSGEDRITGREAGPQRDLDVEWWDQREITRICDAASACRARLDDLKVVHRMQAGIALTAAYSAEAKKMAGSIQLRRPVITSLSLLVDDEVRTHDGFVLMGDWQAGLLAARRAATYAAMAWCASKGRLLFKEKWLMTVLARSWPDMAVSYWQAMSLSGERDVPVTLDFAVRLRRVLDQQDGTVAR